MTTWLLPANTKFYDVFAAFELAETYWPMNAKIADGDRLYIYLAAPFKQVGFVCDVLKTGYNLSDIFHEVSPFIKGDPSAGPDAKPFMKLANARPFAIDSEGPLTLSHLKENGLNGMLMGARKLENNPALMHYIEENTK